MPGWRKWQTRQVEGLVPLTGSAGSNPVPGTTYYEKPPTLVGGFFMQLVQPVERQHIVPNIPHSGTR